MASDQRKSIVAFTRWDQKKRRNESGSWNHQQMKLNLMINVETIGQLWSLQ